MSPEDELKVAVLAVKQGLLKPGLVKQAVDFVNAKAAEGKRVSLLRILYKNNLLTPETVEQLLTPAPSAESLPSKLEVEDVDGVIEGFEIVSRAGQGGMGAVFEAYTDGDERVALKVLYPAHAVNQEFVERFERESRLLSEFDHPNIARGFEWGKTTRQGTVPLYWVSMEFLDGESVLDMITREGRLDEPTALHVIRGTCEALQYMMERGILHRDIKPENIIWDSQSGDHIILCDLGFAKPIETDRKGERESTTCGTVQYISPEQAKGYADVDIRADIYSLGATLYHMLVGQTPFGGQEAGEIMAKQVRDALDGDAYRRAKVSPFVQVVIEKMMSKDRDYRYQTPAEIVKHIDETLEAMGQLEFKPKIAAPMIMRDETPRASSRPRRAAGRRESSVRERPASRRKPISSRGPGQGRAGRPTRRRR